MFASALLQSNVSSFVQVGARTLAALHESHFSSGVWWRTEQREALASASDLGWLLDVHLDAFEASGDDVHLGMARAIGDYLLAHYWDGKIPTTRAPHEGGGFFSSSDHAANLIVRPKELFDGATPSSHAVACRAFARLFLCTGDDGARCVAERLVELASAVIASHPAAVPDLVLASRFVLEGIEIVIPGDSNPLSEHVRSLSMSHAVLITGHGSSPLLRDRKAGLAYVCRRGVCLLPASTIEQLEERLNEVGL